MLSRGRLVRMSLVAALILSLVGCSTPSPVLYPNAQLKKVGQEGAEKDIEACEATAKEAGATSEKGRAADTATNTAVGAGIGAAAGAAGGAVVDAAGSGSLVGAVSGATFGLLRSWFRPTPPSQAYMHFVDRCLRERGYEPVGWER